MVSFVCCGVVDIIRFANDISKFIIRFVAKKHYLSFIIIKCNNLRDAACNVIVNFVEKQITFSLNCFKT